jgi:UTP--glucose-1-phosphate uridylyltransferase
LIDAKIPVTKQMVDVAHREGASTIGVMNVSAADVGSWGIVEADSDRSGGRISRIRRMVEKPKPGTTPSTLAVVGRYILSPRIFHHLRTMAPGAGGEIQLTDGIAHLLDEERVVAYAFEGRRYDCGSKLGYLEAMVELGLKHHEVGAKFAAFLKQRQ